jgi:hypothetical protein
MTYTSFAVRASYMDAPEFFVWVSKMLAEFNCIGQVFFESSRAYATEHRQAGKKVVDCLLISHLQWQQK